jgi:beta-glucosidase
MNGNHIDQDDFPNIEFIHQTGGPTIGLSRQSGVGILRKDGFVFKDLNKNGKLDKYGDWRLSPEERAADLASKMTIEQIAGLMLFSSHQALPAQGWFGETYCGKPYKESGAKPYDLTDQQVEFLTKNHLRHMLLTQVESPETAAKWNNKIQALAESLGFGIPVNIASDPRHSTDSSKEFNAGAGGKISMWPEAIGLAATFDPEVARRFGEIAAKEYRALGITTALSPQIDLATDPRWIRFNMTFGDDPQLVSDMARAYIDGLQTSEDDREIAGGWGFDSVNAMAKHWPGGGTGEGGRDAHFGFGKFAVYPGNNFQQHLVPFLEGAFKLDGPTRQASAVMPYYTISYGQDRKNGENVGNAYSSYIIQDLLRNKYDYDGVICTDWGITNDPPSDIRRLYPGGKCWGVEEGYTVAERHYKLLMTGIDQFGH